MVLIEQAHVCALLPTLLAKPPKGSTIDPKDFDPSDQSLICQFYLDAQASQREKLDNRNNPPTADEIRRRRTARRANSIGGAVGNSYPLDSASILDGKVDQDPTTANRTNATWAEPLWTALRCASPSLPTWKPTTTLCVLGQKPVYRLLVEYQNRLRLRCSEAPKVKL